MKKTIPVLIILLLVICTSTSTVFANSNNTITNNSFNQITKLKNSPVFLQGWLQEEFTLNYENNVIYITNPFIYSDKKIPDKYKNLIDNKDNFEIYVYFRLPENTAIVKDLHEKIILENLFDENFMKINDYRENKYYIEQKEALPKYIRVSNKIFIKNNKNENQINEFNTYIQIKTYTIENKLIDTPTYKIKTEYKQLPEFIIKADNINMQYNTAISTVKTKGRIYIKQYNKKSGKEELINIPKYFKLVSNDESILKVDNDGNIELKDVGVGKISILDKYREICKIEIASVSLEQWRKYTGQTSIFPIQKVDENKLKNDIPLKEEVSQNSSNSVKNKTMALKDNVPKTGEQTVDLFKIFLFMIIISLSNIIVMKIYLKKSKKYETAL